MYITFALEFPIIARIQYRATTNLTTVRAWVRVRVMVKVSVSR